MAAKRKDAASKLAASLVRVLEAQRGLGSAAYPLPLRRLAELTDPAASPEQVQAARTKQPFKGRVVCGHARHPNPPVALVEDVDQLAGSPLLLEFVLEQVCTPDSQTCTIAKLKTKVPLKLKQLFAAAVQRRIADNTLPASVGVVVVKKQQQLHLRRYELPRPPEQKLAEDLVRVLKEQQALGDGAYPLLLARLVELTQPDASGSLVAKAVAQPAFKQAVLPGLKGKDPLQSPVALIEDSRLLAESPLLLETAVQQARTKDNHLVTVAKLKAKVTPAVWPLMESALRRRVQERSLPAAVGGLMANKQPALFLMSDLVAGRTEPSVVVPVGRARLPPSLESGLGGSLALPTGTATEPPAPLPRVERVAPPSVPDGAEGDFARLFDEAFRRLEQQARTRNYVSLVSLRQALAGYDRRTFDAELRKLRALRRYTLSAAEGRSGITPEEQEAGIVEDGALLLYVSRKLP